MITHLRARGLLWLPAAALATVGATAWFASWLATRPNFNGHLARVPAVVLGSLMLSVLAVSALHRADDELEGSAARPTPWSDITVVVGLALSCSFLGIVLVTRYQLERGGLEIARDLAGLTGLALLGCAILGSRLAWALPFTYTSIAYLAAPHDYTLRAHWAGLGWLMFPATYPLTWTTATTLLVLGALAQRFLGATPRPRHHPLR